MASTEGKKLYVSTEQKKHPKLVSAKFSPDFTQKDAQMLWQEISEILNSCIGAKKDWKSWRKTWQDKRCRTKSKSSECKSLTLATGGGPVIKNTITDYEDKVLETITVVAIEGHTNVKESNTEFTFDSTIDAISNEVAVPPTPSSSAGIISPGTPVNKVNDQPKKIFPRAARKKLVYASQAAGDYRNSLDVKNKTKSTYYEKKSVSSERIACAKERCAAAKERSAAAKEAIAAAKEKSAEAKADIAKNIYALAHVVERFQDIIS